MTARRFDGRGAIVAGGASGLGAAIAKALAAEGARVLVADLDEGGAATVAGEIVAGGGRAAPLAADVTNSSDVARMVRTAEEGGGLHVLVLAAAVEIGADVAGTSD